MPVGKPLNIINEPLFQADYKLDESILKDLKDNEELRGQVINLLKYYHAEMLLLESDIKDNLVDHIKDEKIREDMNKINAYLMRNFFDGYHYVLPSSDGDLKEAEEVIKELNKSAMKEVDNTANIDDVIYECESYEGSSENE